MELPYLSDGVIFLRPLQLADAAAHLAGEDDEIATYLSGGRSTAESVQSYIERSLQEWRTAGPRRACGVFDCRRKVLIGSVEANLALPSLRAGQVNLSYGVFQEWRGQGVAARAVRLLCEYLQRDTDAKQAIVRVTPGNFRSVRVAEKAGFRFLGAQEESAGSSMLWYAFDLH